jgi:hypothetical protein
VCVGRVLQRKRGADLDAQVARVGMDRGLPSEEASWAFGPGLTVVATRAPGIRASATWLPGKPAVVFGKDALMQAAELRAWLDAQL